MPFNLFGNNDNNQGEDCPSSGWTVRPSVTNRSDGDRCPTGDHEVTTTSLWGGAVRINSHKR